MGGLSRSGLAERWTALVGALVSVAFGVALVQSSLLLLISAATLDPPPGLDATARMTFENAMAAAVTLLAVVLGVASFLATFIVSSTFAFTVNQRRRELALLRLVGASRSQLRRMLLGEAVLLGGLGAGSGVPAGLGVAVVQTRLLEWAEFVPAGFTAQWRSWILPVSLGTGITLSVTGALVAARRAARVQPLEALLDTGQAARVMTAGRWIAGTLCAAGTAAMMIIAPHAGVEGGVALSTTVPIPAAMALAALAPLLVPVVALLVPTGTSVAGTVARANLRAARRRSASIAGPLIVVIGLVVGIAAAGMSFTTSGVAELRRTTSADLVVAGTGPIGAAVTTVPGVALASTEATLPATVRSGDGDDAQTDSVTVLAIDPTSYVAVHLDSHRVAALHGRAVAAGPAGTLPTRGSVEVRLPGADLGTLPVTAPAPASFAGGAGLLLPRDLVPAALLASAPTRSFVTLAPGADRATVRSQLAGIGSVSDLDAWLAADAVARNVTDQRVMIIVMGFGGLYALIGVVNSVVIGAATRRREFATARLAGLGLGQVVWSALLESCAVTLCGVILGGVAAGTAFVSTLTTTSAVTGSATLDLPWGLAAALIATAALVTGVTSVVTSLFATRPAPVRLVAATG